LKTGHAGALEPCYWHGMEATDRVTGTVQQQFSTNMKLLSTALFSPVGPHPGPRLKDHIA
jgi:hypothetical protein